MSLSNKLLGILTLPRQVCCKLSSIILKFLILMHSNRFDKCTKWIQIHLKFKFPWKELKNDSSLNKKMKVLSTLILSVENFWKLYRFFFFLLTHAKKWDSVSIPQIWRYHSLKLMVKNYMWPFTVYKLICKMCVNKKKCCFITNNYSIFSTSLSAVYFILP